MYKHRLKEPLQKAIDQGKKYFFFYGNGITDCYLENIIEGSLELSDSLCNYFFKTKELNCNRFVEITDHVEVYRFDETRNDIEDESKEYLSPPQPEDELGEVEQSEDKKSKEADSYKEKLENSPTALFTHVCTVRRKVEELNAEDGRTVVFFKDFEWLAALYMSPEAENIRYVKMLRDFFQLESCYVVVSIADIELLKGFHFETEGSNVIFVGNPSAQEVKYSFMRRYLETTTFESLQDDYFKILDQIAQAMVGSKKSLREAMHVFEKIVIEKEVIDLNVTDFEIALDRITDEKVFLDDVIIESRSKEKIINMVDAFIENEDPKEYQKGFILTGPPGNGKTEIVKALANEYNCFFSALKLSDLKGEYIGQSSGKVKRAFDEARANAPTIMFIDEADTVFPSRNGGVSMTDSYSLDMVNQFLQEIEGATGTRDKIFVIAATNRPEAIDSAVQSRLSERIPIELPSAENRIRIFDSKLKNEGFSIGDKSYRSLIEARTVNMSGRDINNYVKSLKTYLPNKKFPNFQSVRDLKDDEDSKNVLLEVMKTREEKLISELQGTLPVQILHPYQISMELENIYGYGEIKERICRQAKYICYDQKQKKALNDLGVRLNKGVLLYGPPGNAKTKLAEAIAKKHGLYFFKVLSKDFASDYVDVQLERIQTIFQQAILLSQMCSDCKGVLLFFDEVDSLANKNINPVVRGTLLDYLAAGEKEDRTSNMGIRSSQSRIMLMAATNFIEKLDEAVIRKGRIDEHLFMGNPSREAGISILLGEFRNDSSVDDITDELATEIYQNLQKQMQETKESKEVVQPSGSEIMSLYNELKAEAYFEREKESREENEEGKVIQKLKIDRELVENFFSKRV